MAINFFSLITFTNENVEAILIQKNVIDLGTNIIEGEKGSSRQYWRRIKERI
jgi:hypothetical protein